MSPTLRLWISPNVCSLGPHILVNESSLPFSLIEIDVIKSGFPSEYAHINPKKRVPILELDDQVITEGTAIMTAIAQLASEKRLLGKTDLEVVRTYEWLNWISGTLHAQAFGGLFRPARFVNDEGLFDIVRERSKQTIHDCYTYINGKLEGKNWLVGDGFTAADAFVLIFYRWGVQVGFGMENDYPNFTRLVGALEERPSVKAALDREGLQPLFHGSGKSSI
ncbi:glutathione S-transferase [Polyplosphaeria fusca]|uniref:Glutathione S-transferase n=1 Tax=Polyplosphaeria fusca TaxID=682080 RepID=A0A9P4QRM4_9PLEO|nr:glutathione S-transferase [Polyplosphaeria fusca]